MSVRPPSCEDCYFKKNLLCAMELDEPCATFRPNRPEGISPPRLMFRTPGAESEPRHRRVTPVPVRSQPADRCASALAKACWLLPPDIRDDQADEWVDELRCAHESGRPVLRRAMSLALIGIPRLRLQRWLRSLKGAIR